MPSETAIRRVMEDTGMEYLQAYRHVQARDHLNRTGAIYNRPGRFAAFERYWNDPAYRDGVEAQVQSNRDRANAAIDEGMRKARERRALATGGEA